MSSPAPSAPSEKPPPQLRSELEFNPASVDITGAGGVVIHDPMRHKFFRISQQAAQWLSHFQTIDAPRRSATSPEEQDQLKAVAEFLAQSRLTDAGKEEQAALIKEYDRSQKSIISQIIHGYVSFRIPLFNPEPFLDATLPWARACASRTVTFSVLILGLIGLYFTSRQWDQFASTFAANFSISGAFSYGLTVLILKIFHELGHAYVARSYGCRVPLVGITFMVMVPMLFTEATDAWRLPSNKQRFAIGAAGVTVELVFAAIALFLWAFLPDGTPRAVAFFVAVTAWIMSVMVNLSPFMRFDGYHMLVDALGMHSLGPRAFKLFNWRLRELLFKPNDPPPEYFSPTLRQWLLLYAISTLLYRLSLYLGIAWLVYVSLPKAVGIPMGAVEVWFFILLPIIRELKEWNAMGLKNLLSTKRSFVTLAVSTAVMLLLALPLDRHVSVAGVLLPSQEAWIYPPEAAQVVAVLANPGDAVVKGQPLIQLAVSDIESKNLIALLRLAVTDARLNRIAADAEDRAQVVVLNGERETIAKELHGLEQRRKLLAITAPFDGVISGQDLTLHQDMWVGRETALFHLIAQKGAVMMGLVPEREAGRITQNAEATFIAEDGARTSVGGIVTDVGLPGSEGMALKYLSQQYGGAVEMPPPNEQGQASQSNGHLPVTIAAEGVAAEIAIAGTITVAATPQSVLGFALGRVVTVALRESGF